MAVWVDILLCQLQNVLMHHQTVTIDQEPRRIHQQSNGLYLPLYHHGRQLKKKKIIFIFCSIKTAFVKMTLNILSKQNYNNFTIVLLL